MTTIRRTNNLNEILEACISMFPNHKNFHIAVSVNHFKELFTENLYNQYSLYESITINMNGGFTLRFVTNLPDERIFTDSMEYYIFPI